MGTTLNKKAYQKLIDENLAWLDKQKHSCERDHIISIVKNSVKHNYPEGKTLIGTCGDCEWWESPWHSSENLGRCNSPMQDLDVHAIGYGCIYWKEKENHDG